MNQLAKGRTTPDCDVVVVGAGFAGIYALWQARQRGFSVRGLGRLNPLTMARPLASRQLPS